MENAKPNSLFIGITADELNNACKQAIKKYGFEAQIKMLIEEMAELIVAICQLGRTEKQQTNETVRLELADVFLMLWQMSFIYGDFEIELRFKLDRLKKKLQEKKQ